MNFEGKCRSMYYQNETGAVTQRVIKGHQIVASTCKIRGSMIRGSMDLVHILMNTVHGPGPSRGSMDQGSMFCTFPVILVSGEI